MDGVLLLPLEEPWTQYCQRGQDMVVIVEIHLFPVELGLLA